MIAIQDFKGFPVRVYGTFDAPLFVVADICRILEIANPSDALRSLDTDERMTIANSEGHCGMRGGAQSFNVVTESGLYAIIFKSRKSEAKAFRKWVTKEVLPAIRKSGAYLYSSEDEAAHPVMGEFFSIMDALTAKGCTADVAAATSSEMVRSAVFRKSLPQGERAAGIVTPRRDHESKMLEMIPEEGIESLSLITQWRASTGFKQTKAYNTLNGLLSEGRVVATLNDDQRIISRRKEVSK